jgi:RNA pseudouridylate synthase
MYGGDARRTVSGALAAGALLPSAAADALPCPRAVHRLDAAVGGLVVVAKTAAALSALSLQFETRSVHKVYLALLRGRLEAGCCNAGVDSCSGSMDGCAEQAAVLTAAAGSCSGGDTSESIAISSSSSASTSMADEVEETDGEDTSLPLPELLTSQLGGEQPFATAVAAAAAAASATASSDSAAAAAVLQLLPPTPDEPVGAAHGAVTLPLDGRACATLLRVLGHSAAPRYGGWLTTAALSPVTGRKHQLRRHTAALGHAIVGDGLYAADRDGHIANQGIYLESVEVWLRHPQSGASLRVSAPEPARFVALRGQQALRAAKLARAEEAAGASELS